MMAWPDIVVKRGVGEGRGLVSRRPEENMRVDVVTEV